MSTAGTSTQRSFFLTNARGDRHEEEATTSHAASSDKLAIREKSSAHRLLLLGASCERIAKRPHVTARTVRYQITTPQFFDNQSARFRETKSATAAMLPLNNSASTRKGRCHPSFQSTPRRSRPTKGPFLTGRRL
jgi:hypothetical protein